MNIGGDEGVKYNKIAFGIWLLLWIIILNYCITAVLSTSHLFIKIFKIAFVLGLGYMFLPQSLYYAY